MKTIGIIGFGLVGKSYLRFIQKRWCITDHRILVWHTNKLSGEELEILEKLSVELESQLSLEEWASRCDLLLPSPGVSVPESCQDKIITELDLFSSYYKKPIVSVTGTVGKTTVTFLAAELLSSEKGRFHAIGNIGAPMLDFLARENSTEGEAGVVIELSSYQLEHLQRYHSAVVIMTNCYQNHLDRHKSFESYLKAKLKIIEANDGLETIILPASLWAMPIVKKCIEVISHDLTLLVTQDDFSCANRADHNFISYEKNAKNNNTQNKQVINFYYNQKIIRAYEENTHDKELHDQEDMPVFDVELEKFPTLTVPANILQLAALLYAHKFSQESIRERLARLQNISLQEHQRHRQELCHTYNNIMVYNDSKATVPEATLAAVATHAATGKKIHLILGGFDKGIDRRPLVQKLALYGQQLSCYYFGERTAIFDDAGYSYVSSLEALVQHVISCTRPGELILFSPSGSSHDLFAHYKERGDRFVALVRQYGIQ